MADPFAPDPLCAAAYRTRGSRDARNTCRREASANFGLDRQVRNPSSELIEKSLRLFQIGRIEAFGEPLVDGSEEVARFHGAALITTEPGETHGGAQLPYFCALPPRHSQRALKTGFCLALLVTAVGNQPLTSEPVQLGFEPSLARPISQLLSSGQRVQRLLALACPFAGLGEKAEMVRLPKASHFSREPPLMPCW